jgi:uncharacterized protein YggE
MKNTFLATLAMLMMLTPAAHAADATRTLQITGVGKVERVPDAATMSLGVITQGATAAEALTANSQAAARIVNGLKEMGVPAKDIATSNFSIQPQYDYSKQNDGKPPVIVGYNAQNTVNVRFTELDKLGSQLDKLVSFGANTVSGPYFIVSDAEGAEMEARSLAMKNAMEKAEIYAKAGGFRLGDVISVSEGGSYHPQPKMMRMQAMEMAADAPSPIEAGSAELGISVNVVIEIR